VRAFLLGDAAHIHACQQAGMTAGPGDAINLAWKLKAVLGHGASYAQRDADENARIAFAQRLVKTDNPVITPATA
jgi:2-polyprenyl-6-methoxyphenol hydroxylase-like FAD-dependent oxidoreductase